MRQASKLFSKATVAFSLGILVISFVLPAGCSRDMTPEAGETEPSEMSPPIVVDLSMSGAPYLEQPVELIFTATSSVDSPNTCMSITLPEGFVLVNGDLQWKGNIAENETRQLKAAVKAAKTGSWIIKGTLENEQESFENSDFLYVSVSEGAATVSETPSEEFSPGGPGIDEEKR